MNLKRDVVITSTSFLKKSIMRIIYSSAIITAVLAFSSASYADTKIDCKSLEKQGKGCTVCFEGADKKIGQGFKPFLSFTAKDAKGVWYFDDENEIVYEFKTLTPNSTTWGVHYNLLQYPDDFIWNTLGVKKYRDRKVHFFPAFEKTRVFETQKNKAIKLISVKGPLTDEYDFRFKYKMKYRVLKTEDKLGKKKKRNTCVFYRAVDEVHMAGTTN